MHGMYILTPQPMHCMNTITPQPMYRRIKTRMQTTGDMNKLTRRTLGICGSGKAIQLFIFEFIIRATLLSARQWPFRSPYLCSFAICPVLTGNASEVHLHGNAVVLGKSCAPVWGMVRHHCQCPLTGLYKLMLAVCAWECALLCWQMTAGPARRVRAG
jgi:hypothetical protein